MVTNSPLILTIPVETQNRIDDITAAKNKEPYPQTLTFNFDDSPRTFMVTFKDGEAKTCIPADIPIDLIGIFFKNPASLKVCRMVVHLINGYLAKIDFKEGKP